MFTPIEKGKITRTKIAMADAIEIFKLKGPSSSATSVGKAYGVSEKAIRDIWKGRTWAKETWHLDMARPWHFKRMGRPTGSKDKNPRKKGAAQRAVPLLATRGSLHSVKSVGQYGTTEPCQSPYLPCIQSDTPTQEARPVPDLLVHANYLQSWSEKDSSTLDDLLLDWELNPQLYGQVWDLALTGLEGPSTEV